MHVRTKNLSFQAEAAATTDGIRDIRIVTPPSEGRQTLGVPIGPDQWVVQWLERNGEKIDAVMDAIDLLGKHDHDLARQTAARHDNRVMESLGKLMGPHNLLSYGTELSEADGYGEAERAFSRAQAQLPMRNGGGGLISASGISPVAFSEAVRGVCNPLRRCVQEGVPQNPGHDAHDEQGGRQLPAERPRALIMVQFTMILATVACVRDV